MTRTSSAPSTTIPVGTGSPTCRMPAAGIVRGERVAGPPTQLSSSVPAQPDAIAATAIRIKRRAMTGPRLGRVLSIVGSTPAVHRRRVRQRYMTADDTSRADVSPDLLDRLRGSEHGGELLHALVDGLDQ